MELLKIAATHKTPEINFNPQTGIFLIKGFSTPEDSTKYYQPVMQWLEEYAFHPAEKTVFNIQLEYYNTSSSKWILELLYKIEEIHHNIRPVEINWYYNDEDMCETGEDYKSLLNVPFNFIEME